MSAAVALCLVCAGWVTLPPLLVSREPPTRPLCAADSAAATRICVWPETGALLPGYARGVKALSSLTGPGGLALPAEGYVEEGLSSGKASRFDRRMGP